MRKRRTQPKKVPPAQPELEPGTRAQLDRIQASLAKQFGPLEVAWQRAAKLPCPWAMRLRRGQRTLAYLLPDAPGLVGVVVLGDRAAARALADHLPAPVLQLIREARPYAEGRSVRLPLCDPDDTASLVKLVQAKLGPE